VGDEGGAAAAAAVGLDLRRRSSLLLNRCM
jgi:hypothetical protein